MVRHITLEVRIVGSTILGCAAYPDRHLLAIELVEALKAVENRRDVLHVRRPHEELESAKQ
jgi:hypothetical protein